MPIRDNRRRSVDSEYTEITLVEEEEGEQEHEIHHRTIPVAVEEEDCKEDVEEFFHSHGRSGSDSLEQSTDDLDYHRLEADEKDNDEEDYRKGNQMDKIIRMNNKRMQLLLESNKEKDERLEQLEQELHRQKVQNKEGIYWLQLQLDTARREKDAAEERMAELQNDLQQMLKMEPASPAKEEGELWTPDANTADLQEKLKKYETAMAVMENQVAMVNTSCGEVVKTLKEEIADLMEDRTHMELDLLNQLSALDNEKRRVQLDYEVQLQMKNETIERLRSQGSLNLATSSDVDDLEEEVILLQSMKQKAEELLERERAESEEVIHRLEEEKASLERKLEAAADDLAVLRSGPNSKDAVQVLERIAQEREAINTSMVRVSTVWELADSSILSLENTMDQLRPTDDTEVKDDLERMLSTLESASLVHGQIKVSLLLIELKLRNQLQCLKSDRLTMGWAAPSDQEVNRSMEEIQKDALTALSEVEAALSSQMHQLEETALKETKELKDMLQERVEKLAEIQEQYRELEAEVSRLKSSNQDSSEEEKSAENGKLEKNKILVSAPVMNQLHSEVVRIVERIQEKNETIASLKAELEEHKTREEKLKKELKRVLRANTAIGSNIPKDVGVGQKLPARTRSMEVSPKSKKQTAAVDVEQKKKLPSPTQFQSPKKTPVKLIEVVSPRRSSSGQSPVLSTPVLTPTSGIRPLQPSRREITKPKYSPGAPPFAKAAYSPIKSPTGVMDTD